MSLNLIHTSQLSKSKTELEILEFSGFIFRSKKTELMKQLAYEKAYKGEIEQRI